MQLKQTDIQPKVNKAVPDISHNQKVSFYES